MIKSLIAIIRDVLIIVVLTAFTGTIAAAAVPSKATLAIAVSNLFFGTIGFIISGCLARGNRWRHLAGVAFGVWLAVLINVFLSGFTLGSWLWSTVGVVFMAGVGGALSYFYRKDEKDYKDQKEPTP